jgi:hypothetical protein
MVIFTPAWQGRRRLPGVRHVTRPWRPGSSSDRPTP